MSKRSPVSVAAASARGVAATVVMSASFLARPRTPPPPKVISLGVARRAGLSTDELPQLVADAYWIGAHLGFGAALAATHRLLGRPRRGVLFGVAAWGVNYGAVLPALGLYPRVDRDDPVRAAAGLLGHVIFGAALGDRR